jgi:hypothetical protein
VSKEIALPAFSAAGRLTQLQKGSPAQWQESRLTANVEPPVDFSLSDGCRAATIRDARRERTF